MISSKPAKMLFDLLVKHFAVMVGSASKLQQAPAEMLLADACVNWKSATKADT